MVNTLSIMRLDSITDFATRVGNAYLTVQTADVRSLLEDYKRLKQKELAQHELDTRWDRAFPPIEILRNT
jgi:hypothetical protein